MTCYSCGFEVCRCPRKREYTDTDPKYFCDNVAPHVKQYHWPKQKREEAARALGPNWASILNGFGDQ